jgi:hypothetical protein
MLELAGERYWIKHLWKLEYIITIIYRGRWNTSKKDGEYVLINANTLQRIIGDKFATKALRLLKKLQIVESDNFYVRGYKSRGYRFKEPYQSGVFLEIDPRADVSTRLALRSPQVKVETIEHEYLLNILRRVSISYSISNFWTTFQPKNKRQEDYYRKSIEFIQKHQWFFTFDPKTGRVFNNITSLPSVLRPFLLIDGKPLIEIDVANCQPLLMLTFYKDEPERHQFAAVVNQGRFYEMLNSELKKPYPQNQKDKIKKAVFKQIMFGGEKQKRFNLYKTFAKLFPLLASRIQIVKTPNHAKLALVLQSLEAELMIKGVVGKIAATTKIPVLTIHDSILTFPEHEMEMRELITNQFDKRLGIRPLLKTKDCFIEPEQKLKAA